ncbi:MAG: hypothetical protein ACK4I8_01140 [Armatimonadota bacterium]
MNEPQVLRHSSRHNSSRSRAGKRILTIAYGLTLSLVLTLIAFLPSIPHMGTSFVGLDNLGDQVVFAWNFWWARKALVDPKVSLWQCDYIFHPDGVNLANHTLMPLHSFWLGLLEPKLGAITCLNILTLLSTWLTCFAIFLFALELGISSIPATACTVAFGLSAFRAVQLSGGQINVAMLEGVVFQAYFLLRLLKFGKGFNVLGFVASILYIGWTEKMGLLFAVFLDIVVVATHFGSFKNALLEKRLRTLFLLAWFISFVGIAPILWLSLTNPAPFPVKPSLVRDITWFLRWLTGQVSFEDARKAVQGSWGSAGAESADLLNFVGLSPPNPFLPASKVGDEMPPRVFPGSAVLVIILVSLLLLPNFRNRSKGWLIAFVCFALLCLGPLLRVAGKLLPLPLPYAIMHYIPILEQMRAPYRFAALTSVCVAVLVGMALEEWLRTGRPLTVFSKSHWLKVSVCVTACLLLLTESLSWWWRLHPIKVSVPQFFYKLAQEEGDFAILEIPIGRWGGVVSVGTQLAEPIFYQCVHEKRIVGGAVARAPVEKVMAILNDPLLKQLLAIQEGANFESVDTKTAFHTFHKLRIRYIVVYGRWINSPVHKVLLQSLPLEPSYRGEGIVAYKVANLPAFNR